MEAEADSAANDYWSEKMTELLNISICVILDDIFQLLVSWQSYL